MKYDVSKFEELVEQGYLRKQESGDLVQYTYTEQTEHERFWNEYTRLGRGIILEKSTGIVVAKPFEKFFNLGAIEETFITNLPQTSYKAYEKMDGSLGIIYYYNGKWNVATKGSFESEQAIKGQELLKKYDIEHRLAPELTYLVEIIYPKNKIVVNYGDKEELVLLAMINKDTGEEVSLKLQNVFPICNEYNYTISEMIELQKTLPKDQEGFVVRFDNGFRVKIKGDEYLKIHKIISCLSPLSAWEVMIPGGIVDEQYLVQIPEEYQKEFEPIVNELQNRYNTVLCEILEDVHKLPNYPDLTNKRDIGIFAQNSNNGLKHPKAIFPYILNNCKPIGSLHKYILNQIRPTGNVLTLT